MNARQTKKELKKKIWKMERDSELMRSIIDNCDEMQRLYNLYKEPLIVINSTMQLEKYQVKKRVPLSYDNKMAEVMKDIVKQDVTNELIKGLKERILYEDDIEMGAPVIKASIFVGKKDFNTCASML